MNGKRALDAGVLFVAGILVLLAGAVPGSKAQARPALPKNGPLTVITSDLSRSGEYVATVARRGRTKLLYRPGCCELLSIDWSPNGRWLAFSSTCLGCGGPGPSLFGINLLDTASGKRRRISKQDGFDLAWSPKRSRLAVVRFPPDVFPSQYGSIHVMKLDGSADRPLSTGTEGSDSSPSWSPSGTRLAFDTGRTTHSVSIIDANGSNRRLLAADASTPAWSPKGGRIAVQAGCGVKLFTPAGEDVTPNRRPCGAIGLPGVPVWSPDGRKIAIQAETGIYVMNADGSGLHLVTTLTGRGMFKAGRPAWRPRKG